MTRKFWAVVREANRKQARHASLDAARAEAGRLAAKERSAFLVLECVGAVRPVAQTEWDEATAADDPDPSRPADPAPDDSCPYARGVAPLPDDLGGPVNCRCFP